MSTPIYRAHMSFAASADICTLDLRGVQKADTMQVELVPAGAPGAGDTIGVAAVDNDASNPVPLTDDWGNGSPFSLNGLKYRMFRGKFGRVRFTYTEAGGGSTSLNVRVKIYDQNAEQCQRQANWPTATAGSAAGTTVKASADGD